MSEFNELKKAVEEVLMKHLGGVALNAFELEWVSMPFPSYRIRIEVEHLLQTKKHGS